MPDGKGLRPAHKGAVNAFVSAVTRRVRMAARFLAAMFKALFVLILGKQRNATSRSTQTPIPKRSASASADLSSVATADSDTIRSFATVVHILKWRALQHPDKPTHTFLGEDGAVVDRLNYAEMDVEARKVAGLLQTTAGFAKGDRVILAYPPGLDFVVAFWGCLYAGAIAVPVYPPNPQSLSRDMHKFRKVAEDSGARIVLTTHMYNLATGIGTIRQSLSGGGVRWPTALQWLTTDALPDALGGSYVAPELARADIAFFQYTSGSTSDPKAVMVSHGNIMGQMLTWDSIRPGHVLVSWLPSYHDMGLVGYIIVPMVAAAHVVQFSPISFIKNPFLWVQTISKYGGTHTCAPNFAYALTARKTTDAQRDTLELSQWQSAICASEPIRPEALNAFVEKFAPAGFRADAFNCGYGLAEVTLTCTRQNPLVPAPYVVLHLDKRALETEKTAADADPEVAQPKDIVRLVGCGRACPDQSVVIVDPDTHERLPEDRVGEIWVSGSSNAQGYWRRPEQTEAMFRARIRGDATERPHLRTGDLGFIRDGELYVTGRIKDIIIVRGRNILPQDIELTVEQASDRVRPGCVAAFSVEKDGEERLVVAAELRELERPAVHAEIVRSIQDAVFAEHHLACHAISLLRPRCVPKTTSGKIQRHGARSQFLAGTLRAQHSQTFDFTHDDDSQSTSSGGNGESRGELPPAADIERWLLRKIAPRVPTADANATWAALGMDSVALVGLAADLGNWLGIVVPPAAFFERTTVRALAAYVASGVCASSSTGGACAVTERFSQLEPGQEVPREYCEIEEFPEFVQLQRQKTQLEEAGIKIPYLPVMSAEDRRTRLNFNTYNYLGLAGHPTVAAASKRAIDEYGTSMCSSPIVGQTRLNVELEEEIASFLGVESAMVFIGGHSANVTTIGHLVGPQDLILCDALNHNSIVMGQRLSRATVVPFPHNDWQQADRILAAVRHKYRRVLIVIEGVFSMDGDIPNLPEFVSMKRKHGAMLYVDEAHSIGVLGRTGRGLAEYHGVDPTAVDVWMGTLSKAMGSCGGYIAGSKALVEYLKFTCPGFVFSVGMTPANAAAALESLRMTVREPERVTKLAENARLFLTLARERGMNVGRSHDSPVVPVIIGDTQRCARAAELMAKRGIDVKPIIYPAVEENQARLRFFLSQTHTVADIERTIDALTEIGKELGFANPVDR